MVFVLNHDKQPLAPCHSAVARKLLKNKKAAIWRIYPFTIILKEQKEYKGDQEFRLKIDYGSRYTGLAILSGEKVVWIAELHHRWNIKELLEKRSNYRRRRRSKNLRYRKCRFNKNTPKEGWIPPSLQSRVDNIKNLVRKLRAICPITHISYENVKFDTQLMQNPEITGVEYQQGTLQGYEVWEYLLEKYNHTCCYCGKNNVQLEKEHIIPRCRGGSNRVSNLCLACHDCNQEKGTMTAEEFGYPNIQKQAKVTLKDAALVTATRWKVYDALVATGLPVECGSGARTKMNRKAIELPKTHYYDACCVGASTPDKLQFKEQSVQVIVAKGRGSHCRTNVDKQGFPRGYLSRQKYFFGYQTGDMVKAIVTKGKHIGTYIGRVLCRKTGSFDIKTKTERKQGISYKYMKLIQGNDGYEYKNNRRACSILPYA